MLRLILAVLFRAGSIEVSQGGEKFTNYSDPRSRPPFTNNNTFKSSLFTPVKPIDLKTLTRAVKSYEALTGETVDVDKNAIAETLKKFAAEEMKTVLPVETQAKAHQLPVLGTLQEFRDALAQNAPEPTLCLQDDGGQGGLGRRAAVSGSSQPENEVAGLSVLSRRSRRRQKALRQRAPGRGLSPFPGLTGGLLPEEIGVLFSPTDPANRLFPPQRMLDDILALLNSDALKDIWAEDETIGWVYQYFTPKELWDQVRKESAAPRNSYELAFRNQFFTPRYVVEFLTDKHAGSHLVRDAKGQHEAQRPMPVHGLASFGSVFGRRCFVFGVWCFARIR
ncbi:MAG: hypothetical protein ACK4RK_15965 [Gemmataceae bacterium]